MALLNNIWAPRLADTYSKEKNMENIMEKDAAILPPTHKHSHKHTKEEVVNKGKNNCAIQPVRCTFYLPCFLGFGGALCPNHVM